MSDAVGCKEEVWGRLAGVVWFFFFKQKTAYELLRGLVGSEMCIRDRSTSVRRRGCFGISWSVGQGAPGGSRAARGWCWRCLLYTSDAADDLPCVDLGGRRIIKKKKTNKSPKADQTLQPIHSNRSALSYNTSELTLTVISITSN